MKIVTDNVSGESQALGNLLRRQSFVISHLKNRTLAWFEPFEHLLRKTDHLGQFSLERAPHPDFNCGLQFFPPIEMIGDKVTLPVKGPVVGVLQDPHSWYALAGVEIRHGTVDVQKNRLDYFFGLTGITDNSECHIKYQPMITIEENREGILAAFRNLLNELLVRELRKIFRGQQRPECFGDVHLLRPTHAKRVAWAARPRQSSRQTSRDTAPIISRIAQLKCQGANFIFCRRGEFSAFGGHTLR